MEPIKTVIFIFAGFEILIATDFNRGYKLSAPIYKTLMKIGLYGCARNCGFDTDCRSFTYHIDTLVCELSEQDHTQSPEVFLQSTTSIYGDRGSIVSNLHLMGSCQNHDCPDNYTCVPLDSGNHQCILSVCEPPSVSPGTVSSNVLTPVGDIFACTCSAGYRRSTNAICLTNGEWSDTNNLCVLRDCGQPPSVANASWSVGMTTVGGVATYRCNVNYTLSGTATISCRQHGLWQSPSFVCEPDCVNVPSESQRVPTASKASFGDSVIYTCADGYTKSGTGARPCEANGQWGTVDIVCTAVVCGVPPSVSGTTGISFSGMTYLHQASYTCAFGLISSNPTDMTITCTMGGVWSDIKFACLSYGR